MSDTSDVLNNIKLSFDPGRMNDNGRFYSERWNGSCLCVCVCVCVCVRRNSRTRPQAASLLRSLYLPQLDIYTHTQTDRHGRTPPNK